MGTKKWIGVALAIVIGCDSNSIEDATESAEAEILEEVEFRGGSAEFCASVYTFEHEVAVGDGAVLRVVEKFSPASVLRFPRRALVMLPGTLVTGEMYDMDVGEPSDFSGLDRAAEAGFFAYAVTYEGYPGSSQPANGGAVTAARSLDQIGSLIEMIRFGRGVPKVDLLGTSFGSSLSIALGGSSSPIPTWHIGRIVLEALVYKEVTPLFEAVFFSPEVQQMLEAAPDGYVTTAPQWYGLILAAADPVAVAWANENYPNVYATGPTLAGFDLPVFDAEPGVVPALQFWGDADPITPFADVEAFQAEYGGPTELRILPGAGHAPIIAATDERDAFWSETFEFLDYGASFFLACEPQE